MALRIVLVDDDENLAELLRANLALDPRFQLLAYAANGRDGVRLVAELRPDAVLMDLHMPVLGGVGATREIVAADPRACVIVFTSSADPGELDAARRAGATAVLGKPFDPEAFLDAVAEHARRCQRRGRRADAA